MTLLPVAGRLLLAVALIPFAFGGAFGQETIASDRPGIGSGSYVLGLGTVQLEAGVGLAEAGNTNSYSLGQALVRVGLDAVELHAILNSYVIVEDADEGWTDIGLGAKARLYRDPSGVFALSALGTVSFPIGADFLSADEVVPGLTLLADYSVTDRLAIAGNAGVSVGTGDLEDTFALIITPSVSVPNSNLGVYFGYAGFYADSGELHFIEGGLALLATPNLQLDLNGGYEIENEDFFVGVGFATRYIR